ncbi:MAG: hypothetical protein AVDCRST_MAG39-2687, partial [uncultured Sphingomonadaceae bacterium]
ANVQERSLCTISAMPFRCWCDVRDRPATQASETFERQSNDHERGL